MQLFGPSCLPGLRRTTWLRLQSVQLAAPWPLTCPWQVRYVHKENRTEQLREERPAGQPHTQSNKQNTVIADEAHTKYINSNRRRTRAYRSFEASKLH